MGHRSYQFGVFIYALHENKSSWNSFSMATNRRELVIDDYFGRCLGIYNDPRFSFVRNCIIRRGTLHTYITDTRFRQLFSQLFNIDPICLVRHMERHPHFACPMTHAESCSCYQSHLEYNEKSIYPCAGCLETARATQDPIGLLHIGVLEDCLTAQYLHVLRTGE